MDVGTETQAVGVPVQHSRAQAPTHDGPTHDDRAFGDPARAGASTEADPLSHPDPYLAADAAATENLLRCWLRETRSASPVDQVIRLPLPTSGTALTAPVRYWSATGHHRFGQISLTGGTAVDAVTVTALLAREAAAAAEQPLTGRASADLVARVVDSVRCCARFLTERRSLTQPQPDAEPPADIDHFLEGEQALLFGHSLHPTPKSRAALNDRELAHYSPELGGSFRLHWFAVADEAIAADSAWTRGGRPVTADRITAALAGSEVALPADTTALPVHPWQARHLLQQPMVRQLIDRGLLHDIGPCGRPWYPTSSLRTVYQPGAPAMLKLSLGIRITNSRRENLHKELHRGLEVHRLLRTGLVERWHATHPGFDIVRDPAWIAVLAPQPARTVADHGCPPTQPVAGFNVVIRHNPVVPEYDITCLAGLLAERPWPGQPPTELRSRLALLVTGLADSTGRPVGEVTAEWFLRYLHHVVAPILWLDGEAGIALEAHQQNTLVVLDAQGWPCGGRYRDNQGYYFRESHAAELDRALPGIGKVSDTFVADEVVDERFAYYLGINNILGLIGALGAQQLADERVLLAAFRRFLTHAAAEGRSGFPARVLSSTTLRCKANLLTRLHGMDELVGPVDTQSVYVPIANPLITGAV